MVEKLKETRAQPGTNELGSPASSEGLALQDQRASGDTHPSHGRCRQLYTQMHDDMCCWDLDCNWELLDQNPGNSQMHTNVKLCAQLVSTTDDCKEKTPESLNLVQSLTDARALSPNVY